MEVGLTVMWRRVVGAWNWLPIAVRAILIGSIVAEIGSTGSALFLFGNLIFHAELPWALPAVVLFLCGYYVYFSGRGWPNSTRAARNRNARVGKTPRRVWWAAMPVIILGALALLLMRLTAPYVMPVVAPQIHIDLSVAPNITVVGILIAIAFSSAIAEELGYRGYMQQPMEERYGIVVAILISGTMFWVAHLPEVTISHLPGHLAAAGVFGLLAYYTRSLWPAILTHAAADLVLQPMYLYRAPAIVWDSLSARPLWEGRTTNLADGLVIIARAADPTSCLLGRCNYFSVLAWLFLICALGTVISLANLARVSALHRPHGMQSGRARSTA